MELNGHQIRVQQLILSEKFIMLLKKYDNLYFQYAFKILNSPPKLVQDSGGACMYLKYIIFQIFLNSIVKSQIILPTESKSGIHFFPSHTVFFYNPVSFIRILATSVTEQKKTEGDGEKWIPDLGPAGYFIQNLTIKQKKI